MRTLYLGLDAARYGEEVVHRPIIQIVHRSTEEIAPYLEKWGQASHVIVTSRVTAKRLRALELDMQGKTCVCVGKATAEILGECETLVAPEAHGEGVVTLLKMLKLRHVFFPHSARAREVIAEYLNTHLIPATIFELYTTVTNRIDLSDWQRYEKIVFTSPSTVAAFFELVGEIPPKERCEAIGPITEKALSFYRDFSYTPRLRTHQYKE